MCLVLLCFGDMGLWRGNETQVRCLDREIRTSRFLVFISGCLSVAVIRKILGYIPPSLLQIFQLRDFGLYPCWMGETRRYARDVVTWTSLSSLLFMTIYCTCILSKDFWFCYVVVRVLPRRFLRQYVVSFLDSHAVRSGSASSGSDI